MKKVSTWLITLYQKTLSPDHGPNHRATCRFIPTCSEYGKEAIEKHGFKGYLLTFWRILRCNPLVTKAGTIDSVP
ncbi:MAG: membrane protein insertion efficiency factor YidD [Candidatus Dojkabacteria bacterium]|nr:MAG: membrane protein insertion efficiency factor YidD [Candidatus Dojkabacteria bacterium]